MDRRAFIGTLTGGLLAAPVAVGAQSPQRVAPDAAQQVSPLREIGVLFPGTSMLLPMHDFQGTHAGGKPPDFSHRLRELGYIDGQNIAIRFLSAESQADRLPTLVNDLVDDGVSVIVAIGDQAVEAARRATRTIPIVMAPSRDPVRLGFVVDAARPGGNITGLATVTPNGYGKRLHALKEIAPAVSRVAVISNSGDPSHALAVADLRTAASGMGETALHLVAAQRPTDFPRVVADLKAARADTLVVVGDPFTVPYRAWILNVAATSRLPAIFEERDFVEEGGLISYGPRHPILWGRAADYVDRILKGAQPRDLPVEQPTKFELVINLKTAKAPRPDDPVVAPAAGGSGDRVVDRRAFIGALTGGLLAAPLAAGAQPAGKVAKIGLLTPSSPAGSGHLVEAFRQGIREVGYIEGTFVLEARYGDGRSEHLAQLAQELVRWKADVIVTSTDAATAAVRRQTRTIPIVMAFGTDPVGTGFVASLGRPGGNVTGLSNITVELGGKRLELLKDAVPKLSRVAFLWNPDVRGAVLDYKETEARASSLGLELHSVEVSTAEDLDRAFAILTGARVQAFIVAAANIVMFGRRAAIARFAQSNGLASMYAAREYVDAGGLLSYGASVSDMFRRSALYVDKILKGAKPANLPVEQPTKFELVINLKTAKALGLTIPPSLLQRADQVIE